MTRTRLAGLKFPALFGAILVLPFLILEWINRRAFGEPFPFVLFGVLWLLPAAFALILRPVLRDLRAGHRPIRLLLGFGVLALIAWLYIALIADQMPCFLGVPNCD